LRVELKRRGGVTRSTTCQAVEEWVIEGEKVVYVAEGPFEISPYKQWNLPVVLDWPWGRRGRLL
jgi:hypothetical protein